MKSVIALLTLLISFPAQAQNLSYEVIRTQESPGYFALRVYPGDQLPPLQVETVFVTNYTTRTEKSQYADLIQAITNSGAQVLKATQAADLVENDNYRLVLLGGPKQNRWLQFKAQNQVIEEFETFSQNHLGPVYLANLGAEFGGNVTEVRPAKIPYLNDQATYFVGQFEKPMKTRVSLAGETEDLVVQADGIMDLSTYQPHPAENIIAQLWQDFAIDNRTAGTWDVKKVITNSFPLLLGALGLLLMYLASRPSRLRTGMMDKIDEFFWNTPVEETPLYQAWEKSLPWELSDEELKLAQVG